MMRCRSTSFGPCHRAESSNEIRQVKFQNNQKGKNFRQLTMKRASPVYLAVLLVGGLLAYQYHGIHAEEARAAVSVGEIIYMENCAVCHGRKGDGKGLAADRLKTKPRDFTTGQYKFQSTPSGSLPLDEDIFRTISQGVRTTSMLAQLHLSERERWAVTEYLKTFSVRFKSETTSEPIRIGAAPRPTRDLVNLGKRFFADAGCGECHGADGKGDGPSAKDLKDDAGSPILPADLTVRPFKSGPLAQDLYRTISTGLGGTPMPSHADVLSPKELWGVVYYVQSIATGERQRGMMGLVGEEVQGMRIDMEAAMAGMMGGGGMMGK
jgi:cytochrome c oxidase cbb3-type subunit 2